MTKEKKLYQADTIMKDFWRKTINFNDVCNGLMFTGETVIQDAVELDSEQGTTTEKGSIQRRRDLIKKVSIDGKDVDYEVFQTKEVKDFFARLQSLYSWDKDIRHLKNLTLTYDTALALGVVTGTQALIDKAEKERGGMINMCQAVDEALQESKLQGFQEGEMQGEEKGKRTMITQQLTKKFGSLSNTVIERLENSTAESIDRLIIAIFDIEDEEDILQLIN